MEHLTVWKTVICIGSQYFEVIFCLFGTFNSLIIKVFQKVTSLKVERPQNRTISLVELAVATKLFNNKLLND
jgi:hypothetical protein